MATEVKSVVLEEILDENYDPTEDEIADFAHYLGMDLDKEPHLMWIAEEGLKAALPAEWKPCQTDDGQTYYFNFKTGESRWDHPCDDIYKALYQEEKQKNPVPPPDWESDEFTEAVVAQFQRNIALSASQTQTFNRDSSNMPASPTVNFVQLEMVPEVEPVTLKQVVSNVETPADRSPSPERKVISSNVLEIKPGPSFVEPQRKTSSPAAPKLSPSPIKLSREKETVKAQDSNPNNPSEQKPFPIDASHQLSIPVIVEKKREEQFDNGMRLSSNQKKKSYLGSILDHIDDSMGGRSDSLPSVNATNNLQSINESDRQSNLRYSTPSQNESEISAERKFSNDSNTAPLHKDTMDRVLQERIEDMKKQYATFEQEERRFHETKLQSIKESLTAERESLEKNEKKRLENQWLDKKREIESDFMDRRRIEERRFNEDFESFKKKLQSEYHHKEELEKQKQARDFEDAVKRLRRETEERVMKSVDEKEFRIAADQKLRILQEQLEHEMDKIRAEYHSRRADLIKQLVEKEDEERRKIESQLQDVRLSLKQKREEEEASFEKELAELRSQWNAKIRSTEKELEAREKHIRIQLTDAHQRQLKDKEEEFQRLHQHIEFEWNEKINALKHQMASEQSEWEERLLNQRKQLNSRSSSPSHSDSLSFKRQEIERLTRENDQLLAQQKRRKDFLDSESKLLDKVQEQIDSRKRELLEQRMMVELQEEDQEKITSQAQSRLPTRQDMRPVSRVTTLIAEEDDYQQEMTRAVSPSKSVSSGLRRRSSSRQSASKQPSRKSTIIVNNDEELDLEALGDDDGSNLAGNVTAEQPAISREIEKNLKRQQKDIAITRQYLQEQQNVVMSRQQELEESRKKWREELAQLNKKLDSGPIESSAHVVADSNIYDTENILAQDDTEKSVDDLSSIIRQLRKSIDRPKKETKEYSGVVRPVSHFTSSARLSASVQGPSPSAYSLSSSLNIPRSSGPLNVTAGNILSAQTPRALSQLSKWEEERKRSADLLKSHSSWLNDFRTRIGMERSTFAPTANRNK